MRYHQAYKHESHESGIWTLFAFVGRYAHQAMPWMMQQSKVDLQKLAKAVAKIMSEESEQTKRGTDID